VKWKKQRVDPQKWRKDAKKRDKRSEMQGYLERVQRKGNVGNEDPNFRSREGVGCLSKMSRAPLLRVMM
jgi:hypothetical protein